MVAPAWITCAKLRCSCYLFNKDALKVGTGKLRPWFDSSLYFPKCLKLPAGELQRPHLPAIETLHVHAPLYAAPNVNAGMSALSTMPRAEATQTGVTSSATNVTQHSYASSVHGRVPCTAQRAISCLIHACICALRNPASSRGAGSLQVT
jgi:hypothetical protein